MAVYPGRHTVNDTLRLEVSWQNEEGVALDPDDVVLKTYSPLGTIATYYYSESQLTRESTGNYYHEITPNVSGRWHYRWEAVGEGVSKVVAGNFNVQFSPFYDSDSVDAYRS
jgi:hypothetical protein